MIKRATTILATIFMALAAATPAFAQSSLGGDQLNSSALQGGFQRDYKSYDYIINDYDVKADITEDGDLKIVETIQVFFAEPHHGIIRKIPLVNSFDREGEITQARAKIKDVSVNEEFTQSRDGNNRAIKIGNPGVLVSGEQNYEISYTYNMGRDRLEGKDDLYFNIIGTQWEVPIRHVSFALTMPKDFDPTQVYFYTGGSGTTQNLHTNYKVEGRSITGKSTQTLAPGEAITVRVLLPDGYFIYTPPYQKQPLSLLLYIIPIAAVGLSWILWAIFGNDKFDYTAPSDYPPAELSCPEISLVMNGSATHDSVMAMLFSLANRGYIRIVDNPETSGNFNVVRMKDYDGDNELERMFMDGLFEHAILNKERRGFSANDAETGMEIKDGGEAMVTSKTLSKSFYKTVNKISAKANSYRSRYYETNTALPRFIAIILALVCAVTVFMAFRLSDSIDVAQLAVFVFPVAVYLSTLVAFLSAKGIARVIGIVFVIVHASLMFGGMWMALGLDFMAIEPYYLCAVALGVASAVLCALAAVFMTKLNDLGSRYYSHISTFRDNLKRTASGSLRDMAAVDMRYAYDILPYAFMFGLTSKWMKKFSDVIKTQPPEWYSSHDNSDFDFRHFSSIINTGVSTASRSPYSGGSSSSGGSSGGGSSGGGGGGGGGSAW